MFLPYRRLAQSSVRQLSLPGRQVTVQGIAEYR